MRRSTDFTSVVRVGFRARTGRVVVHHDPVLQTTPPDAESGPALVGLVVSKSVGNSVQRHAVSRRLRAQLAVRLDRLALGSGTVVRALPGSAASTSAELARDLDRALSRLSRRPVDARVAGGVR